MWCFGGEIVVECVAIVVGRQSFVWWLKTCQLFEIYFWILRGRHEEECRFGNGAPRYQTTLHSLTRVVDGSRYSQRQSGTVWGRGDAAVHEWMIGVGFVVLLMTPCFLAMRAGMEDSDDN